MDHGDGAGHAAGTVGVVDIVVARRGDKLLIRVERELTLEVRARLADGRGKAARLALLAAVHIGRDDDRAAAAADAVELGKGLVRLVEQVDDVRGDDHVELPVRFIQVQNIGLTERDVRQRAVFLLRPLEHVGGEVRREKRAAALGDGAGEQSRAAGAFKHRVVWRDAGTDGGNERLVRFFIKDVGEEVIDPRDVVPEHEYFPLNVICFSTR